MIILARADRHVSSLARGRSQSRCSRVRAHERRAHQRRTHDRLHRIAVLSAVVFRARGGKRRRVRVHAVMRRFASIFKIDRVVVTMSLQGLNFMDLAMLGFVPTVTMLVLLNL